MIKVLALLLCGCLEPAQRIHAHRIAIKALQYRLIMLLNKYGCRRKQCDLLRVHYSFERGAQCYLRLAIANVTASAR